MAEDSHHKDDHHHRRDDHHHKDSPADHPPLPSDHAAPQSPLTAAEAIPERHGGRVTPSGRLSPAPKLRDAELARPPLPRNPDSAVTASSVPLSQSSASDILTPPITDGGPTPTFFVTSMGSRNSPPPGTAVTPAPLNIVRKHSNIRGCYVVALEGADGARGPEPDVRLETRDNPIDATLYLTGPLGARSASSDAVSAVREEAARTARIDIRTAATVRARLQRGAGVSVDASVATTKSRIYLWLPNEFDGLLTVHARRHVLSPLLADAARLRPAPGESSSTYQICLHNSHAGTALPGGADGAHPLEGGARAPGPDRIFLHACGTARVFAHIDEMEGRTCAIL